MRQGWQEMLLRELLLLLLLLGTRRRSFVVSKSLNDSDFETTDNKILFGDKCTLNDDCGFEGSRCVLHNGHGKCQCLPELAVTNHIDKCGKAVRVNDSCFFHEQCEATTPETECRDGLCACRFEKQPETKPDGNVKCVVVQNVIPSTKYIDPAMIGILVAMFLMFITICVVLRLFSRKRTKEVEIPLDPDDPDLSEGITF